MKNIILIDGNSVGYSAQHGNQNLSSGGQETTAIFGAIRSVQKLMQTRVYSRPIILWDGRSWRYDVYPEYKGNRDKNSSLAKVASAYKTQQPEIMRGLRLLGMSQMVAGNMEADDLAAIIARRESKKGQRLTLITGDKDWLQIVDENTTWVDHKIDRKCDFETFEEFTGCATPKAFTDVKAMCGDAGDNVKGCGGIGEKGAIQLMQVFGTVEALRAHSYVDASTKWEAYAEAQGLKSKKWPKKFENLRSDADTWERFQKADLLMNLGHPDIPAPKNIRASKDKIDHEGFLSFCMEHGFHSILRRPEVFMEPFYMLEQEYNNND